MAQPMETMRDFFTARVQGYDAHMLAEVEGCREAYAVMAGLVPPACRDLLDLGCGTGLELDAIFARCPDVHVTGIDLTPAMLDRLRAKHPDKAMRLICGDYLAADLGRGLYDCAVSFQTMPHFTHEAKTVLYRRIRAALRTGGAYLECDYMVETQAEEDLHFAEYDRLRRAAGLPADVLCHYDTPCTVANQRAMLLAAGFTAVREVFRKGHTTLLVAKI